MSKIEGEVGKDAAPFPSFNVYEKEKDIEW